MGIIRSLLIAAVLGVVFLVVLYVASPSTFLQLALAGERTAAGLESKDVEVDGFRIAYLDSGGVNEPLVLVHGFGADKDAWNRVARTLSRHFRIIALDMPGYGESSSPPDAHYGIDDEVKRLHAFVSRLELTHVHLGGFSMGGFIVGQYAATYPNEVGSVWLIGTAGVRTAPKSELTLRIERGEGNPLIASTPEDYRGTVAFVMNQPPFLPPAVIRVLAKREVAAHDLRVREYQELSESPGLEGKIDGLPLPVHILWGEKDRCLHVGAVDILKRLLPQASATILPDVGHLPMLEAADPSAADYLRFREGVSAASPVRPDRS